MTSTTPTPTGWTRERYALFRILLGVYLVVHLAALVPFAAELFSRDGVVPSIALNPLGGLFPNCLLYTSDAADE